MRESGFAGFASAPHSGHAHGLTKELLERRFDQVKLLIIYLDGAFPP